MIDLNSLQKIEFHDQTLSSVELDFENQKINISVCFYSESIDDFLVYKFNFIGVSNLKIEDFEFDNIRELTIGSFNFNEFSGEYLAEFIFIDIKNFSALSKIRFTFIDFNQELGSSQ